MSQAFDDDLTPTQRRQEIAALLGRGLRRYLAGCTPASGQIALDVSACGDPHVSRLTEPRA